MPRYDVKIGSLEHRGWGTYTARNTKELAEKIADQIENLAPLNSSKEGAELYRERFRGKPVFALEHGKKDYVKIAN